MKYVTIPFAERTNDTAQSPGGFSAWATMPGLPDMMTEFCAANGFAGVCIPAGYGKCYRGRTIGLDNDGNEIETFWASATERSLQPMVRDIALRLSVLCTIGLPSDNDGFERLFADAAATPSTLFALDTCGRNMSLAVDLVIKEVGDHRMFLESRPLPKKKAIRPGVTYVSMAGRARELLNKGEPVGAFVLFNTGDDVNAWIPEEAAIYEEHGVIPCQPIKTVEGATVLLKSVQRYARSLGVRSLLDDE